MQVSSLLLRAKPYLNAPDKRKDAGTVEGKGWRRIQEANPDREQPAWLL